MDPATPAAGPPVLAVAPTQTFVTVDGRECRLWIGRAEDGTRCLLLVAGVAAPEGEDTTLFDRWLTPLPAETSEAYAQAVAGIFTAADPGE